MSFVREHKWLVIFTVLSLMTVAVGVVLIKQQEKKQQQAKNEAAQLELYNQAARQAAQELIQTVANADQPLNDMVPESSLAKVKALNGKVPEVGSDDWCELMMTKNADTWSQDEQTQFAQHCI